MPACPNCGRETLRTEDWVCQWCGYPLLSRSYKKIDKTYKQLQEERGYSTGLPEPEPELELEPRPEPEPEAEPELELELVLEPEPVPEPELVPEPEPELVLEPEPEPELELEPEPKPEPEPVSPPKLEATADGVEISVDELNLVYQADKLAAHAKLTEQILKITGLVGKVFVRDHLDIRYIVLTGDKRAGPWSVRCSFGKESASQLNRLSKGQMVTVRGKYDGYGKNIIVKDCVLVS